MKSIQHRMAESAAWVFAARWVDKGLGLVSTLVLARLLAPGDFGLVAMATVVVAFLELMTRFGFDSALIQHSAPTREHYDTVWSISLLFGLGIAGSLVVLAYPIAQFYSEPRLVEVLFLFGVVAVVGSAANVGVVDFRRNLQFHKEFQLNVFRRLLALPIVLGLAFWLRDYRALVLGTACSTLIGTVLTFFMHPFRPRWSLSRWSELFSFSKWLFVNNLLGFVCQRSSDLLIGRMRGAHELGVFTMANEFGALPSAEVAAPINRAAFPGYARLAANKDELTRTFLQVTGTTALVVLPIGVGIALTAPLFVPLLLGPKWTESIPLMQLLALSAALLGLWTNTHYVLMAIGKPKLTTVLGGTQAVITVLLLYAFLTANVRHGAGWALLLATGLTGAPAFFLWKRELSIGGKSAARMFWRPLCAVAAMAAFVGLSVRLLSTWSAAPNSLLSLMTLVLVGACTYAAAILALWKAAGSPAGPERFLMGRARALITTWKRT